MCAEGGGWSRRGVEFDRQSHLVQAYFFMGLIQDRLVGKEMQDHQGTLSGAT